MLPDRKSVASPPDTPMERDPSPEMPPVVRLRLCPPPSVTEFEPESVSAFAIVSPVPGKDAVVAVVVIEPFDSASAEPLSVNVAVWPEVPLFVNDIVPSVIVPMVFVLVVCVAPPKDRFQVPDVVGIVLQLDEVDQLPEPPPPVHVALPMGTAKDGDTPTPKAWTPTIAATKRQLRIIRDNGFIRLTTAVEN